MLTRTSRADALVAHVEQLIDTQCLKEGDRIASKGELRDQTGLSIATISEGIRLLQAKRRVIARPGPGGGLFVAEIPPLVRLGQSLLAVRGEAVTLRDSVVLRDALEPVIAADAARYRDEDDVADLRGLIEAMSLSLDDPAKFLRANWRLHRRIAKISQNELVRTVYLGVARTIEDQVTEALHPEGKTAQRLYKHDRLELHSQYVDAIADGDVERATDLAFRHAPDRTD